MRFSLLRTAAGGGGGAQGPGGEGAAGVLGDTWLLNLYTREWSLAANGAGTGPHASHIPVAASDGAAAVAFGGRSAAGVGLGRLYIFDPANGWSASE
jgi:hypothetical protein